jgi:hypothetical protein
LTYLGCIIPPIPPKINLGTWKGDDNEEVRNRKLGIEQFLKKIVNHGKMTGSEDLKSYLTDIDSIFQKRKHDSKAFQLEQL